jgi:hypothetical protein
MLRTSIDRLKTECAGVPAGEKMLVDPLLNPEVACVAILDHTWRNNWESPEGWWSSYCIGADEG